MEETPPTATPPDHPKQGWALAFLSPKGGTGKTLLSASAMHLLAACGKRVVAVDADISTRGLSLFLIGRQMVGPEARIKTESCLTEAYLAGLSVQELRPLEIVGETEVYQAFVSTCELWKDGIPDRRLLGVDETPELEALLNWWRAFMQRLREEFDFIILDTRGGYDFTTALAAVLADERVCVVEADRLSSFQLDDFIKNIGRFGERFELPHKVDSFLINKAVPRLDTRDYVDYLHRIYGATTVGVVPADIEAIYAYQVSRIPLLQSPASDFSHCSSQALARLVRKAPSWSQADDLPLESVIRRIEGTWVDRRRMHALARLGAPLQLVLASLVLAAYAFYRAGSHAGTLNWAYWALYAWALFALTGAAIAAFADHLRHRSPLARWVGTLGLGVVVLAAAALAIDVPQAIRPVQLLERIGELEARTAIQSKRLTSAETEVARLGARRQLLERDVAEKTVQLEQAAEKTVQLEQAAEKASVLSQKAAARIAELQRALVGQEARAAEELKTCDDARTQLENGKAAVERKFQVCQKEMLLYWGQQAASHVVEVALNRLTVHRNKTLTGRWDFVVRLNGQPINRVGPLELDDEHHAYELHYESGPRNMPSLPLVLRVDGTQPDAQGRVVGEVQIPERPDDRKQVTVRVETPRASQADGDPDSFVFQFSIKASRKSRPK